jgi:hypothetical protein
MDYSPKLWHGIVVLLIGTGLFCWSAYWPVAAVFLRIGGGICWVICFYVAWLIGAETRTRLYDAAAYFANAIRDLPEDRLDAIGIAFPQVPLRWRGGRLTETFEDTGIAFEFFQRFMQDSNPNYISPERHWSEGSQRNAWENITAWLVREHYVIPNSASGNQSLLWFNRMYDLAWTRYMTPRHLVNMADSPSVVATPSGVDKTLQHAEKGSTQDF